MAAIAAKTQGASSREVTLWCGMRGSRRVVGDPK
jgi:hypothetical protein